MFFYDHEQIAYFPCALASASENAVTGLNLYKARTASPTKRGIDGPFVKHGIFHVCGTPSR